MTNIPFVFTAGWHQMGWLVSALLSGACLWLWVRWRDASRQMAQTRRLIASAHDAIITETLDGKIQSWNFAAERLFGYAAREMIGQPIARLFPPEQLDEQARLIAEVTQGRSVRPFEALRLRRDGSQVKMLISLSPLLNEQGKVIGATQLAREASSGHTLQEQAGRIAQTRTQFLANMSHELRTPLNGVIGFTHLLMDSPLNPQQREQLTMIDRSAQHLLRMVDDILQCQQLDEGSLHLEPQPFDVHELLRDMAKDHEYLCDTKGLSMTLSLDPGLPRWVRGDARCVRLLLGHLLGNAVKFTPHGGIRLSAKGDDNGVLAEVDDTGIGMSAEFLAHLFEPFSQAHVGTTRPYGGPGLGASICKQLVDKMQGHIEVQSAPGQGTSVRVWLPLPEVDAPSLRRRMLVVDAQAEYLDLLRLLLGRGDQDIVHVTDGLQAMSMASDDRWALVLASDSLPGFRVCELARRVRQTDRESEKPPTPLIALARSGQEPHTWREAGVDVVLEGPVRLRKLLPVLAECGWRVGQTSAD